MDEGLTELQREYIDWRTDPNAEGSKKAWAYEHGVNPNTLTQWERREDVRAAIADRLSETSLSVESQAEVIAAAQRLAVDPTADPTDRNRAADIYMRWALKLNPPKVVVEDAGVRNLSDEELAQKLGEALVSVQERLTAK